MAKATLAKIAGVLMVAIALTSSMSSKMLRAQLFVGDETFLECRQYSHLFSPFPDNATDKRNRVQAWSDEYHDTVSQVIAAHIAATNERLQCIDNPGVLPTNELKALASALPPWSGQPNLLTEEDFAGVLSVYLDAYECALRERQSELPYRVASDMAAGGVTSLGGGPFLGPMLVGTFDQGSAIKRELLLARPTLHRVLRYTANIDRLLPIHVNLRCLERASLDIRNNMSLIASASACSIRKDGRSTVRQLKAK